MKVIGLLGGMSWHSTPQYYEYLNKKVSETLGSNNSARIILYSINYDPIKTLHPDGWEDIPDLLGKELKLLDNMGPDCVLICNNMFHKAYDILVERQDIALVGQVIHAVVATARRAVSEGAERVLLVGNKFTMEDGFFADRLKFFGLDVITPNEDDRNIIQNMQSEISAGQIKEEYKKTFQGILGKYDGCDTVVLGCAELALVIDETLTDMAIVNSIQAQCDEALKMVLSESASPFDLRSVI